MKRSYRSHAVALALVAATAMSRSLLATPWIETALLVHARGAADDHFATSVAIDGDVAVVGDPDGNSEVGAAHVFLRSGGVWTESAMLVSSDGATDDSFGNSVSISGDVIVVGAPGAPLGDIAAEGKAYVFVRPSGGWAGILHENAQLGNFAAAGTTGPDGLGFSVSISGDTVAIGGPESFSGAGVVFVFTRPASGWTGSMTPSAFLESAGAATGYSVGVSGGVVVAGAPETNGESGAVYIWVEPASGWDDVLFASAVLIPANPCDSFNGLPHLRYGHAVAIDGPTVVVTMPWGMYRGIPDSADVLASFVFEEPSTGWSGTLNESALLLPDPATGANAIFDFGESVSISNDTIVIGEPGRVVFPYSNNDGAAYIFRKPSSGWAGNVGQQAQIFRIDPSARQSRFGWAVSISGTTILLGAPDELVGENSQQGAAHVFEPGLNPTVSTAFSPGSVLTLQPSTLTLTVSNPNVTGFLSNIGFWATPSLPAGLTAVSILDVVNTCGGLFFVNAPVPLSLLGLGGTDPMPGGGACTLSTAVSAAAPGTYTTLSLLGGCDQGCDLALESAATLLVRLRNTQTRVLVEGPIRVAPGVPVEFPFEVSAERGEIAGLTGEVVVSDGEGHACRAPVGADGRGSCSITFGAAGRFPLRAQYLGNLSFGGSTSPPESVFVGGIR